jgi:pimeloyl-ACP methyl ester carboxylesterase
MSANRNIFLAVFSALCLSSCAVSDKPVAQHPSSTNACSSLLAFSTSENNVVIKSAQIIPAGPVPPVMYQRPYAGTLDSYCRVDGVIDERIGANGKAYAIGFALALPEKWNGRFMMQGGGGLNGSVATPLGTNAAGDMTALQRGFAVVTTDTGHQGTHGFDASFFSDQEATLNFLYQAIGKVAVTSKQLVAQYYGKAVDHSYYMGCSTGGREAMIMSQRYPRLFDGIVAGAPAMRTSFSNLADKWVMISLASVAPKDEQGHPIVAQALSEQDKTVVMNGLLKQCDALDGVADNMISNVVGCNFDPVSVACKAGSKSDCISLEKAIAIKRGFAGPKNSLGVSVYPGFWFDTGITETQGIPGLLNPGNHPIVGKITSTEMNVDQEAMAAFTPAAFVGDSAYWTLLNSFSDNGGKLIFYHGVSDPWFSAQDTARYYDQLVKDNGGKEVVEQWSRLFLVPGMGHCGGGAAALDHMDMIDPIVNWVEANQAPEQIRVTGAAFPERSRPLCPYPSYAHYTGKGDSENADNFVCKTAP